MNGLENTPPLTTPQQSSRQMKKISLLFTISFFFFVLGQILWSIRLFNQSPLFGDGYIDDWVVNIMFSLCSIFGLIGSYKWYKQNN